MKIIVGLGNPGEKYQNTRHNIGFRVVEALALEKGLNWKLNKKFNAETAEGQGLILVKPQTFMNNSGKSVAALLRYYKLVPSSLFGIKKDADLSDILTVIHDELDLALGKHKLSVNSGSAGHNGVQSIIDSLKTKNFSRLRIGISTDEREKIKSENFVLQKFRDEEKNIFKDLLPELIRSI